MKSLLIHKCTIRSITLGTANSYGEYTSTSNSDTTSVPCRFYIPSGRMNRASQAQLTTTDFKILLSKTATVSEGNLIIGTTGFTGTYTIRKVIPRYDGKLLHHYECDIEGEV